MLDQMTSSGLVCNLGLPLLHEIAPATGVAIGLELSALNPIGAKRAEILPQLAPSGDDTAGFVETEPDWPDDTFRSGTLGITDDAATRVTERFDR
jgi:hypothetical protein